MDLRRANFRIINRLPYLENESSSAAIFSLHVHSKDERLFHRRSYLKRMMGISSFNQKKIRNEFGGIQFFLILGKTFLIKLLLRIRNSARALR